MNIVLIHGVLGFSHLDTPLGGIDYFAGVANHLRERFHATVIAPAVDAAQGTEVRAGQLRIAITQALTEGKLNAGEPVHIIAHSLGGLDSRRMLAENPVIDAGGSKVQVKALAMISTPNRGSPVADVIAKGIFSLPGFADLALQNVLHHFRVSLQCLRDLTTEATRDFNARFADHPSVHYFSYAGRGRDGLKPTALFFLPYYEYIKKHAGANDGMVAVDSARWTNFDADLWPCDHADEIGHDLDHPLQKVDQRTLARYDTIVARFQGLAGS